jgi:hypothetical protein
LKECLHCHEFLITWAKEIELMFDLFANEEEDASHYILLAP